MNIGIFGLGYVGVVNVACFAKLGHTVYGCDVKEQKVLAVLKGKSPVFEPGIEELLVEGLNNQLIFASKDAKEIIENTELALICVGTPSQKDKEQVDLNYIINTTIELARHIVSLNKKYSIVYRSTIPPGTISGHIIPLLKRELGNFYSNVQVSFLPEFLREGSAVKDFFNCSRIVLGVNDQDNIEGLKKLLSINNIPLVITDIITAEFVKYVDNAFHAVKIAFANEMYRLGGEFGINVAQANEIFLSDSILNISKAYLRPGLPFGGSCLPKDLRAISSFSELKGIKMPLLNSVMASNAEAQKRLLDMVLCANKDAILLVGLSFKNNTDDIRESPMLYLAQQLIKLNKTLKIYDPDVNLEQLRIDQPGLFQLMITNLKEVVDETEVCVVCKRFITEIVPLLSKKHTVVNCYDSKEYDTDAKMKYLYK